MTLTLKELIEWDSYSVTHLKEHLPITFSARTLRVAYETIVPHRSRFPNIYQALYEVAE